jgi:hypothetical protein
MIVTTDWWIGRLQPRHEIRHFLLKDTTLPEFNRSLRLSLRRFLIDRKKPTLQDNLYRRAKKILREDVRFRKFITVRKSAHDLWGLSQWHVMKRRIQPFQGRFESAHDAAFAIQDIQIIRYRSNAKKAPPTLSNGDLGHFLEKLFVRLDCLLSLDQLSAIFEDRFDLSEPVMLSLQTPAPGSNEHGNSRTMSDLLSSGWSTEEEALLDDAVKELCGVLSSRQRHVLALSADPDATLKDIADRAGCKKSTVANERKRIAAAILQIALSDEMAVRMIFRFIDQEIHATSPRGGS